MPEITINDASVLRIVELVDGQEIEVTGRGDQPVVPAEVSKNKKEKLP
ncbi:MAG TPA: hypothetical protein HPP94_08640 [Desulfuromonadales bacterium]|nr:hypothetical protein [Desulfuromonadales bacterium]